MPNFSPGRGLSLLLVTALALGACSAGGPMAPSAQSSTTKPDAVRPASMVTMPESSGGGAGGGGGGY